ncbi:hypothetical protein [Phreatobacter stygius]|uniref:Uncharacterized protein n=1 Tax=Phreatobacter stygius TaxID=1940610 RepID=A0A4D7B4W4_9HYPH|nr:hypothetical protein [Phreatobacter stygius]QCI68849.1 hypothetical protein E8M01_34235 [Phreatobacter stygius]
MGKIIEATAIISAEDRTAGAIDSVVRRLNTLNAAMKSALKVDGASGSQSFGRQAADVDKMSNALRRQATEVDRLAASYRALESARAGRGDSAGRTSAIDAEIAKLRELQRARQQAAQVPASVPSSGRIPQRLPPHLPPPHRLPAPGLPMGGPSIAPGSTTVRNAAREGFDEAATPAQVETLMRARGDISEDDIKKARALSNRMSGEIRSFSSAQHFQAIHSAMAVFGDLNRAMEAAPELQRANAFIEALKDRYESLRPFSGGTSTKDFARTFDIMGATDNAARMRVLSGAIIRGVQSSSGDVTPTDYLGTLKYARSHRYGYSNDFLQNYLPGIIGDAKFRGGGATSAGTGLAALGDQFFNLRAPDRAKLEMERLGLIEGSFDRARPDGRIRGRGTARVRGADVLAQNPQQWATQFLLPLIEPQGGPLSGDEAQDAPRVNEAIGRITGNRVAADFLSSMILQRGERERDARIARGMPGIESLPTLEQGPVASLQNLSAATKDFLGSISEPLVQPAISGMRLLGEALRKMSQWNRENPEAAATLGTTATIGGAIASTVAGRAAWQWWQGGRNVPTIGPTQPPGGPLPPNSPRFAPGPITVPPAASGGSLIGNLARGAFRLAGPAMVAYTIADTARNVARGDVATEGAKTNFRADEAMARLRLLRNESNLLSVANPGAAGFEDRVSRARAALDEIDSSVARTRQRPDQTPVSRQGLDNAAALAGAIRDILNRIELPGNRSKAGDGQTQGTLQPAAPVSVTGNVELRQQHQHQFDVRFNTEMLRGEVRSIVREEVSRIPLNSNGPGSTGGSMTEAAPGGNTGQ